MGRREDNKQRKRQRLLAEGLELFLAEGYDRASIEQIAGAAEMARGTFYLYFEDKQALFDALIDRWFTGVMEILKEVHGRLSRAETPAECLAIYQAMGLRLAASAMLHQKEVLLAFREGRRASGAGQGLRAREVAILDTVTALTAVAVERKLIRVADPRLACLVIFGAVERLYYEVLIGSELGDVEKVASQVVRMFARSMDLPVDTLA